MNMTPQEFAESRDRLLQHIIAQQAAMRTGVWHPSQTHRQPVVWRCPNPDCLENATDTWFDFESDYPTCPKCGLEPPAIQKRVLIHLLVADTKGPIMGSQGLRYHMACHPQRVILATATNGEAASNDPAQVNCPGCLLSDDFQRGLRSGFAIHQQL